MTYMRVMRCVWERGGGGEGNEEKYLCAQQEGLADKAYIGIRKLQTPYKARRGQPLTEWQEEFNLELNRTRSRIERVFGSVKNRFEILTTPFRMQRKYQERIIKFCFAMENLCMLGETGTMRVPTVPIPWADDEEGSVYTEGEETDSDSD